MAATYDPDNIERQKQWYDDDVTAVNTPMRKLLKNYSKVTPERVVPHVNEIVLLIFPPIPKGFLSNYI